MHKSEVSYKQMNCETVSGVISFRKFIKRKERLEHWVLAAATRDEVVKDTKINGRDQAGKIERVQEKE